VITILCHPCFGSIFSITKSQLLFLNSNFFDNTSFVGFFCSTIAEILYIYLIINNSKTRQIMNPSGSYLTTPLGLSLAVPSILISQ